MLTQAGSREKQGKGNDNVDLNIILVYTKERQSHVHFDIGKMQMPMVTI
jgi:hypothetical protein